ncbi:sulfotransferase family protein [Aliifodinibius sp. S!AR15-10]|uniref:sulfotransferase family 2 domain-containing protein n=1 Tax=Aliifodinibius sp. S!AR15-10 TaxID=2950437 RepID=UPI00286321BB|nr:sulfotransferase family 2 domain-containing protein [Aliifodinibius sp. S!AR15-10]MDR8390244.1 sulfotransferase family protein [Aliifodinibius sp. S!AR15-10]
MKTKSYIRYYLDKYFNLFGEYDNTEYLILPDKKLIYIDIPKVACTSIKSTIGLTYGITSNNKFGRDIHTNPNWEREQDFLSKKYNDYYVFTFVRNPLSRLVSCYEDKVVSSYNEEYPYNYFRKFYSYNKIIDLNKKMSFEEFVYAIHVIPQHMADRHFKAQANILKNEKIDFIGKFENINEDWKKLSDKFDLHPELFHVNKRKKKKKNYKKYYHSKEILDIVWSLYKDDFKFFDYKNSFDELYRDTQ